MVGNAQLATFITKQPGGNFRATHAKDAVPKLPGYLLGFRHVSPEYWITSGNNEPVTENDIIESTGILNLKGNGGTLVPNADDHSWYFNKVADCAPEGLEF